MSFRLAILVIGVAGTTLAVITAPAAAAEAASQAWPPIALVAGLLLIGLVANEDGVFTFGGGLLSRLPGGPLVLYASAMLLVAFVAVLLNLDTSAAFLTPLAVHVARSRGANEERFLYGSVFMCNAASLLLPGSNLTNLLILNDFHVSGSRFLSRMVGPWAAAVVVTGVVVTLVFRERQPPSDAGLPVTSRPGWLGVLGIVAAATVALALGDAALPMLGTGLILVTIQLAATPHRPGAVAGQRGRSQPARAAPRDNRTRHTGQGME